MNRSENGTVWGAHTQGAAISCLQPLRGQSSSQQVWYASLTHHPRCQKSDVAAIREALLPTQLSLLHCRSRDNLRNGTRYLAQLLLLTILPPRAENGKALKMATYMYKRYIAFSTPVHQDQKAQLLHCVCNSADLIVAASRDSNTTGCISGGSSVIILSGCMG